jgi:hypothetical protein
MNDDLFVASRIDDYRSICISTLARQIVKDPDACHLEDRGYFNDTRQAAGINILAKAASLEAAFRIIDHLESAAGMVGNPHSPCRP